MGGSFDPPHKGHIDAAHWIKRHLDIDSILLIPCHIAPHKRRSQLDNQHRLAMMQALTEEYPAFSIDTYELDAPEKSYTYKTLKYLKAKDPTKTLCFIMGADSLMSFDTWYRWQDLLTMAHFIVAKRPGFNLDDLSALPDKLTQAITKNKDDLRAISNGRVLLLDTPEQDISSSQIRDKLKQGGDIEQQVPQKVRQYIKRHGIYIDVC